MRKKAALFICLIICLLLFLALRYVSAAEKETRIKSIEIKGNRRIETDTIKTRIKTREGDLFSLAAAREDLKTIFQMGYFDDVSIDSEDTEGGINLIFAVKEKPVITEVVFQGNKEVEADKLKEKVNIKVESFIDNQQIKENINKIVRFYEEEGYYDARVTPVIKVLQDDKVSLIFYIVEGEKAQIKEIIFEGNKNIDSKKLKKSISSSEHRWIISYFTGSGLYKKDLVNSDVDSIKDLYLNNGYMDVQVGQPKVVLSEDRKQFTLTYPVIEGDQFTTREIGFRGNKIISTKGLREKLSSKGGDIVRRDLLRKDVLAITDMYGEKGYVFAQAVPQMSSNRETRSVDITFDINEGDQVRVREINIYGNDKTRDKVIRREIKVTEQDIVNTRDLKRSFQKLNNLNFFETVEITPEQVGKDMMDLNVRVKEKSTGTFSVGGGYSSVDRFVALTDVTEGNLFGRGQLIKGKIELGSRKTSYDITFKEPYLFDYPVSGTLDLFNTKRDFTTYSERRKGGAISLGKSFTEYTGGTLSYKFEKLNIFNVADDASDIVKAQIGETTTSSTGLSLYRDSRDYYFDPRSGSRNSVSFQYAGGFLRGDNEFIKTIGDSSWYYNPIWDTVISVHGRLGYAVGISGNELPVGERFYVGGINTIRGFAFGKAGPLDSNGNIIGANKELIFNMEYTFPLVQEAKIKGLLFFDAGKGFDDDEPISLDHIRYSAGTGIRWISPVGPLRLEWGYNLNRKEGEKQSQMEFSIGTLF
ncbi:MAG: outer membrane protein assembly factor BamA [Nitrospirae bacterium]|nr:outer membrane protein assembly factor BamA [Nitrospirota bacterium]